MLISADVMLRKVIICLVDQNFWRTELEGNLEYQDAFDYVSFAPSWFK